MNVLQVLAVVICTLHATTQQGATLVETVQWVILVMVTLLALVSFTEIFNAFLK